MQHISQTQTMQHISQTQTMQRFLGSMKLQHKDRDNVIPFLIKQANARSESISTVIPDWKSKLITVRQFSYIRWLASQQSISIQSLNKLCFRQYGADLATMKRTDASDVIYSLKRSLDLQYKPFHR